MQIRPRWSIFIESDIEAEFIVNAPFSQYYGVSWPSNSTSVISLYVFSIDLASNDTPLVQNRVTVNSTGNLFSFDLTQLTTRLESYKAFIYGAAEGGMRIESDIAEIYYLPEKSNSSVARIDNLNHGIYWKNAASNDVFELLLAYGYYSSFDGFLGADNSTALIDEYVAYDLTEMTPLIQYPDGQVSLDFMSSINLPWMEALRESYQNLIWVHSIWSCKNCSYATFSATSRFLIPVMPPALSNGILISSRSKWTWWPSQYLLRSSKP